MIESRWTAKDELIDILLDLKHDLGKYLFLHLSHLTADSPADATLEALKTALHDTRKVGGKPESAAAIWDRYRAEIDALNYSFDGYERLSQAVANALAMARFFDSSTSQRAPHVLEIQQTARKVSETIAEIIAEVSEGSEVNNG